MRANTPRYLIENHGPNQDAIKTAFAEALRVCAQLGISEITLLVPAKDQFPNTVIGTFLGPSAKALRKGQAVKITDTLYMNLESPKTFNPYKTYGMVIGAYLSQKDQDLLDLTISAQALVLLPWTEEEGKGWLSTWNAKILGASTWQVQQITFPADVENALISLTQSINLSSDLSHSSDNKAAHRTLSNLKKNGHLLAPDDIRKWALRNNWNPKTSATLSKIAGLYF